MDWWRGSNQPGMYARGEHAIFPEFPARRPQATPGPRPLPADHVLVGHLVELVDAARASVRQHHGAGLKHKLAAHGVAADKGREGEGEGRGVSG